MSKSSIPLKLINSGTDLHEYSPIEENYLAYCISQHLTSASTDAIGNLSLSSVDATPIGSFVDTFFNQTTGTHPASQITSGETTTTVHQKTGVADESGSNFKRPIGYYSHVDVPGLYEMVDADLDSLANRVIGKLVELDYPGTFKLASTSPGVDYNVFIDSIFSDTQGDGTSVPYHVYVKNTVAAPTTVRPMTLKNTTASPTFNGQSLFASFSSNGASGDLQIHNPDGSVRFTITDPGTDQIQTVKFSGEKIYVANYRQSQVNIYDISGNLVNTISAPTGSGNTLHNNSFAASIDVSDTHIAVGASRNGSQGLNQHGAVYVYDLDGNKLCFFNFGT